MKKLMQTCLVAALCCTGTSALAETVTRYSIETGFVDLFNFATFSRSAPGGAVSGFFDFIQEKDGSERIGDFAFTFTRPEFTDPAKQTSRFDNVTGQAGFTFEFQRVETSITNFSLSFSGPRFTCPRGGTNVTDSLRIRVLPSTLGTDQLSAIVSRSAGDPICPGTSLDTLGIPGAGNGTFSQSGNSTTRLFAGEMQQPAPVPLPAAGLMLLAALGGLSALRQRRT